MPIIDIELVGATPGAEITQALADELGTVFKAAPGKVWVRVRTLPAENYAENRTSAPTPVFVSILARNPPEGDALERRITYVTEVVARLTKRAPAQVHILFESPSHGRLAFGGVLVK